VTQAVSSAAKHLSATGFPNALPGQPRGESKRNEFGKHPPHDLVNGQLSQIVDPVIWQENRTAVTQQPNYLCW